MNTDRSFLLLLTLAFAVLAAFLVLPYLQYVLAALVFLYVLRPLHDRLEPRIGPRISATVLIGALTAVILLPFAVLLGVAIRQAAAIARRVRSGRLGLGPVEEAIRSYTGVSVDLTGIVRGFDLSQFLQSLGGGSGPLLADAVALLGGLSNVLIGLTILLFLLYYGLVNRREFVAWLGRVTPLPARVQDELGEEIDQLMWAVLVGNVLVGVVQGVLTGIGLAIVGVSNVVFWTVMTSVLSLLPIIGASVIWVPASLYLLAVGNPLAGGFLLVYGAAVVSLSDNYLRPLFVDHEAQLNPGIVILGIFGGLAFLGFMGVFFGPIVLGLLKTLIGVFVREYGRGEGTIGS